MILPLSKPALFAGVFLVIMEVLNEYGAVKYFGVNTYTTGIFRAWFSMGSESTAIQLACMLILIVAFLFLIEKMSQKKAKFYYQSNTKLDSLIVPGYSAKILIYFVCSIPFIFGFLIPFLFILDNSLTHFWSTDFRHLFQLSLNSIKISSIAAFFIILLALIFVYVEKISRRL